ncbi:MAG: hypothetical protein KKI09_02935 [Spirochaetes bacterium]|nr:hypothetical protein [Spirochaetota bacterium]MBU0954360.1 hypothetical protein [Spirochaetota bacterium]
MKHAKTGTLKALLALLLTALLLTACPNPAGPTETTVTLLDIPGVTAPVTGAEAANSAIDTEQYTGTVSWGTLVSRSFEASTEYTAIIELTAKEGYTFKGITADSFSVAGATITNKANPGTVLASFPATAAVPISTLAIPGITVPAFGASPVRAIDADQYSGTITWSPEVPEGDSFAASTVYTATITLTAKTGYTTTGMAADSFTVAGSSSVSHAANSGVITAEFAAT